MTALVVKFKAQQVGTGGGVQARRKQRDEPMEGEEFDAASQPDDERLYSSSNTTAPHNTTSDDNDDQDNKRPSDSTQEQQSDEGQGVSPQPGDLGR